MATRVNVYDRPDHTAHATSVAENFVGGAETDDTVTYIDATSGVTASLASPSINTGWAGGDTYTSIENLTGTQYKDILYGDSHNNVLDSAGSGDTTYAGGGDDTVLGGGGSDLLYGQGGNDFINGQWQSDTIYGGDGNDKIYGGTNN